MKYILLLLLSISSSNILCQDDIEVDDLPKDIIDKTLDETHIDLGIIAPLIPDETGYLNIIENAEKTDKNSGIILDSIQLVFMNSFHDSLQVFIDDIMYKELWLETNPYTGKTNIEIPIQLNENEKEIKLLFVNRNLSASFILSDKHPYLEIHITDQKKIYLYYKNRKTLGY